MAHMLFLYAVLFTVAIPALFAIQGPEQIPLVGYDEFIPFKAFIQQVQRAKYDDYKRTPVLSETHFLEMRKHIL